MQPGPRMVPRISPGEIVSIPNPAVLLLRWLNKTHLGTELFLCYVYEYSACKYVSIPHVCSVTRDQEKASDHLELNFQMYLFYFFL